jgi:hypothetical protein
LAQGNQRETNKKGKPGPNERHALQGADALEIASAQPIDGQNGDYGK